MAGRSTRSLDVMPKQRYTCACCGYRTLIGSPGSYEICRACFWEDDPIQLLDPWYQGGANTVALVEAQRNFAAIGASEECFRANVKPVKANELRDPQWRAATEADRALVTTPARLQREVPNGKWPWYYWQHDV
jgi:hypothetical protein